MNYKKTVFFLFLKIYIYSYSDDLDNCCCRCCCFCCKKNTKENYNFNLENDNILKKEKEEENKDKTKEKIDEIDEKNKMLEENKDKEKLVGTVGKNKKLENKDERPEDLDEKILMEIAGKNKKLEYNDEHAVKNIDEKILMEIAEKNKELENENKCKPKEKINNFKGLKNFALNCYMNSLLQCFYNIKGIRTSFINPYKFSPETQKVCYSLSEVMKGLTYGNNKSFSPNNFKETLGNINSLFKGTKGADVTDLYRTVIDSIISEMPYECPEDEEDDDGDNTNQEKYYTIAKKEVNENNPIIQELNYFYETIYNCPEGYKCYSVQNDTSIMFELLKISKWANTKNLDLNTCFEYNYRIIENNEFYCSKCEGTHNDKSQDKILSLPKVLTIILNRGKGKQFTNKVKFDEIINIEKYVDDTFIEDKNKKYNYKLICVSTHLGNSSNSGHYIAYCYRDNEDKYYCFNDETVSEVNFDYIKNNGEPYILFYEQLDNNI